MKMDIEGAEFEVCKHLVAQGQSDVIDELYLETHGRFHFEHWLADSAQLEVQIERLEQEFLGYLRSHFKHVVQWDT